MKVWEGGVENSCGMEVSRGGMENSCGMEVLEGGVEYSGGMEVSLVERPTARPPSDSCHSRCYESTKFIT